MRISDWSSDVCSSDLLAIGKRGAEQPPCLDPRGNRLKYLPGQCAYDRLTGKLLPQAFGLGIVHDQVRMAQPPGGAETECPPIDPAVEYHRGVAQRAIRHRHGRQDERRVGKECVSTCRSRRETDK